MNAIQKNLIIIRNSLQRIRCDLLPMEKHVHELNALKYVDEAIQKIEIGIFKEGKK